MEYMKLIEEEKIAMKFNEKVILDLAKKIEAKEKELEQLREEHSNRQKIRPYFGPNEPFLSINRGPMSKQAILERTRKIIEILKSNGNINIPVQIIAKDLNITREAARGWLGRQIAKTNAPWKYGKDMSHYSLV